jgi:hypothetical protein
MKSPIALIFSTALVASSALAHEAQEPSDPLPPVGPHHRVIEVLRTEPNGAGDWVSVPSSFVQLEDGLNYWDPQTQTWSEASAEIELTPTGAVARRAQHRAIFSSNVNDPQGALDLEVQHQVRLRSSVLALRYFDPASGQDSVIALIRDRLGELLPPSQVIYRDAFDSLEADVLYTLRRCGLEADVVLREIPPPPEDFGLPSATTRLEVITEFFDPPVPVKRLEVLASVEDPVLRA